MSTGRRSRRKRERKTLEEEGTLDVSDDFQEAATHFRLPKRLLTNKSQENSKKNLLGQDTQDAAFSCKTLTSEEDLNVPQPESSLAKIENEISVDNSDLREIEKTLCAQSEKLCPLCKLIVPSDVFIDHFKECMQQYKLAKEGRVKQFPVSVREGETSEQEKQQPVLPCPVCRKAFKSRTQRVIHIKSCAQDHGLTSEQLLLASRLLEKQHEEWKDLGLPISMLHSFSGPRVRSSTCNRGLKDPDIAMAVALSRSIADEKMESRLSREEKLLALGLEDIIEEDRKESPMLLFLPDSVAASHQKKSGKDRKGRSQFLNSVLVTRSMEERERLISEKVAVLLTSEDVSRSGWQHSETEEKSVKLGPITNKECQLWETARGSASKPLHSFYVPELELYIKPKEATIGNLFRKLSQVPGRLNTTALHALDEESDSDCEMEESPTVEEFCTQMALAGLIGSQEDLDITAEMDWEQITEGMESQGFIIPSHGTKAIDDSDFSVCESRKNNFCANEVMERSDDDLVVLSNAEEDSATFKENCNKELNKEETSQLRERLLESTGHPLFSDSCKTKKEILHLVNESYDFLANCEEKRETQKLKHSIDVPVKHSECYNEATRSRTICSSVPTKSDIYEGSKKQPENSPLYSSQYPKEDTCTVPTRKYYENKEQDLATSGMKSTTQILMSQPCGKDSSYSSMAGMVPEQKGITYLLKEEMPAKNVVSSKSDFMMDTLIKNWSDLLESGIGSDVTITAMDGLYVQAHSLVLMARCPQLYKESKALGKLIKWNKISQKAVHLFLSYLYTGKCEITPGDPLWIELHNIGLHYKCTDLVSYMDLLNQARNGPMKIPVAYHENKTHTLCLPKESRAESNLASLKTDLILPEGIYRDKFFNVKELKSIRHNDGGASEHNDRLDVNESSQNHVKSDHEKHDKAEPLKRDERAQSPDLFDEFLYGEKSCSPLANSPLMVVSHHSPVMETDHVEPEELEEISNILSEKKKGEIEEASNVLSNTSSPCKSVSLLANRDYNTLPKSQLISLLPTSSNEEVLEGDVGIQDMNSLDTESKTEFPLILAHNECEVVEDNDVIDLTQNSLNSPSEERILDLPSVNNCQTETECHSHTKEMDRMDDGNEELTNFEPENADKHYISNVWDGFDADASMLVSEELHSASEKVAASLDKRNSTNRPYLQLSVNAQSTDHKVTPQYLSGDNQDRCSDSFNLTKPQEENSLRCKTSYPIFSQSSFVEFLEGHSGDDILVNAATEIEESEAVCLSTNHAETTISAAAHASYSLASTPKISCKNTGRNTITPKPDYDKMKTPELKKELQKYGICSLGRRKAVAVLDHLYEQTHPLVTDSETESSFTQTPLKNSVIPGNGLDTQKFPVRKNSYQTSSAMQKQSKSNLMEKEVDKECTLTVYKCDKDLQESEDGHLNSSFTSTSSSEGLNDDVIGDVASSEEDGENISSTQQVSLVSQVREIITGRDDLYRKVLLYEPIFLENLHALLKANKIRCSMQALLDALDELCVIVRTQSSRNRGQVKSSEKRRTTLQKKTPEES